MYEIIGTAVFFYILMIAGLRRSRNAKHVANDRAYDAKCEMEAKARVAQMRSQIIHQ